VVAGARLLGPRGRRRAGCRGVADVRLRRPPGRLTGHGEHAIGITPIGSPAMAGLVYVLAIAVAASARATVQAARLGAGACVGVALDAMFAPADGRPMYAGK
jgi:hypothetical protein